MYEKFLDNLILRVLDMMVNRILHEFICLFEITTIDQTANNLANKIEEKLLNSIIDKFLNKKFKIKKIKKLQTKAEFGSKKKSLIPFEEYSL